MKTNPFEIAVGDETVVIGNDDNGGWKARHQDVERRRWMLSTCQSVKHFVGNFVTPRQQ